MDVDGMLALGRVLEAHNNRNWVRGRVAPAKADKDVAEKEERVMGRFEDCGDFYRWQTAKAVTIVSERETAKRQAEKHFKALREGFRETYPNLVGMLEEHIDKQAAQHAAQHQESQAAAEAKAPASPRR